MGMNVKGIREEKLIKNYRECDISLKILLFKGYITISIDIIGKNWSPQKNNSKLKKRIGMDL